LTALRAVGAFVLGFVVGPTLVTLLAWVLRPVDLPIALPFLAVLAGAVVLVGKGRRALGAGAIVGIVAWGLFVLSALEAMDSGPAFS
jgi:hypothetical protein